MPEFESEQNSAERNRKENNIKRVRKINGVKINGKETSALAVGLSFVLLMSGCFVNYMTTL